MDECCDFPHAVGAFILAFDLTYEVECEQKCQHSENGCDDSKCAQPITFLSFSVVCAAIFASHFLLHKHMVGFVPPIRQRDLLQCSVNDTFCMCFLSFRHPTDEMNESACTETVQNVHAAGFVLPPQSGRTDSSPVLWISDRLYVCRKGFQI